MKRTPKVEQEFLLSLSGLAYMLDFTGFGLESFKGVIMGNTDLSEDFIQQIIDDLEIVSEKLLLMIQKRVCHN